MAAEPVDIDTDPLPRVAERYVSKAHQIRRVGLDLSNVVSDYSHAFGDDASGQQISRQFHSLLGGFQGSVHLLARVVDGTADGIHAWSKQYNRVDDHNTELAKHMGEESLPDSFDPPPAAGNLPDGGGGGGGGNPTHGSGHYNGRH
jgi:hypothetical protein